MENTHLITLEQYMVIGHYDLKTYEGKMGAISKAHEVLDLPTEEDKQNLFEAISTANYEFDTGIYYIDTKKPFYDAKDIESDGFIIKENFRSSDTGNIETFFGIDDFKVAHGFTKNELENLSKKFQVYNNENFVLTEYQAHKLYDKENFSQWLSDLLNNNKPVELSTELKVETDTDAPKTVKARIGRARS